MKINKDENPDNYRQSKLIVKIIDFSGVVVSNSTGN